MIDRSPARPEEPIVRIKTGSKELDDILGGGVPENSINIVLGQPGSGKTALVEGLVFANANDERRPSLYYTTLSEPLDKVIKYLQQFDFFDLNKIGGSVRYESLGAELVSNGISAIVAALREAIKTLSPRIIVIDSFKAIHDLATSVRDMRLLMHELGGLFAAYNTTVFLVGEYRHDDIATLPEFAVVDGIIELSRKHNGSRDERMLRVLKLRGSSYREGPHAFAITSAGLEVYPRLVSPVEVASYQRASTRASTGVPGLDAMLAGGLWTGSATLLAGPTGSGKTTASIQFILEGLRLGETCLLVNFQENPTQLAHQMEEIGGLLDDAVRARLVLLYYSAVELSIDKIVVSIFQALRKAPIRRVVIDAIGDLATASGDPTRMHDYLYALVQHFAVMGVTSMVTMETDPPNLRSDEDHGRLSHMTDNIVFLDIRANGGVVGRTLRVAKARGIAHDLQWRALRIDTAGMRIVDGHS